MPLVKPAVHVPFSARQPAQQDSEPLHADAEIKQNSNGKKEGTPRDSEESNRSMGSIQNPHLPAGPPSRPPSSEQEAIRAHEKKHSKPESSVPNSQEEAKIEKSA